MSNSLWPHGLQHARPPCPSPTPRAYSNSCPLSGWFHPAISSSVVPFCSHLQSFPASRSFQMSQFFASGGQSIRVSASIWIIRSDFLQDGLVGSPCCPRDSQESSPTSQFKSINSLVLSFLYSSTLTSIHDQWKNQQDPQPNSVHRTTVRGPEQLLLNAGTKGHTLNICPGTGHCPTLCCP